ncbi:hypothetical protein ACSTJP_16840 [Vibrio parahaemolyticus]|nr:hypothetical protein [Vibrio parahaemolyticus]HCG9159490.1 hypothetical protein [Vibrio parahaemolyticus]HCH6294728.1 hypothetical protein [Vibrio parahaemolyticus]HCH6298149.1 hypothetical protein [Vibrio parahaemolyticus]
MNFRDVRKQYPQYGDMTDGELATALHSKYYNDMPFDEFSSKIGYVELPQHIQEFRDMPISTYDSDKAFQQGFTFGFQDEVESGMRALYDTAMGRGWTYDEWKNAFEFRRDNFREDSPVISGVSEVAGAIPSAIIAPAATWTKAADGASRAAKAWNTTKNLGKLAGEGAAYGALYGAGTSDESLLDNPMRLLSDISEDALVGGVTAPVVGGALKGLGTVFEPDIDAVLRNETYGIDTPLSERYPALKKIQDFLDYSSGGALAASQKASRDLEVATEAIKNVARDDMKSAQAIGSTYIKASDNWIDSQSKMFEEQFSDIRKSINLDGYTVPTFTSQFLREEGAPFVGAEKIGEIVLPPSLKRLSKSLEEANTLTVDALWKLRSEVGDSIKTGKFGTDDINQAKLKQLYGNLSDDLTNAIRSNSRGNAAYRFRVTNDAYSEFLNDQSDLQKIMSKSNRERHSPEKVAEVIKKMMRDEPSNLSVLQKITGANVFEDSTLDEAGRGILYQSSLNRGEVDPIKALERYNISQSKIEKTSSFSQSPMYSHNALGKTILRMDDYLKSPASRLVSSSQKVTDYEGAINRARRAQESVSRGTATTPAQLITSTAIPAVLAAANPATIPAAVITTFIGTYGLRKALSSEGIGEAVSNFIDRVNSTNVADLSSDDITLLFTIWSAQMAEEG